MYNLKSNEQKKSSDYIGTVEKPKQKKKIIYSIKYI